MKKLKLFLWIAFAAVSNSFAQCPVAGFVATDTVCVNVPFTINDTSATGLSYQWDFCAGDLKNVPSGSQVGTFGPLDNPNGMDIVTDGVNWYGFVANYFGNSISRFDFGNSLDSIPPTPTFVVPLVNGFVNPVDIRLMNDNGFWYAIVSNNGNNTVLKLDMDSLTNVSPLGTILPSGVGFASPYHATIVKENNTFKALVAMAGSSKIGIWDFGATMANNPTPAFLTLPGAGPISIAVAKDCNQWYGIAAYITDSYVSRIDFGTTISNVPTGGITTVATLPAVARDAGLANDGGNWFAFVMDIGGVNLTRLDFGPSLNSTTVTQNPLGTLGVFNGDFAFTLEKTGSKWYGFSDEAGTKIINKFVFPDSCSATLITSTDFNPLNPSYTNNATYNICLIVTDGNGNVSFFDDSVVVVNPPQAGFYTGSACVNSPVSFYDTSSGGGSIVSWLWYFGDGDSSVAQNPVHPYAVAPYYVVTLTVTSNTGCTGTTSDTVFIQSSPNAGFSFPPGNKCAHSNVQFTDTSTSASGQVTAWEWNFGDGTPLDSIQNPIHTFDSVGTFTVQLVAFSSSGCPDTSTQLITIVPGPLADFSVSQTCLGDSTIFSNLTTISGGGPLTYHWDFGDLAISTIANPKHLYALIAANYQVQLIASSTNGCEDTVVKNIRIGNRANPGFIIIPNILCEGSSIVFIDTSTVFAGDTIVSSHWDFGDSSTVNGDTVTHIYSAGTYNVMLTVTTQTSCDTNITIPITVIQCAVTACPIANFTLPSDTICANAPFSIYNNSIGGVNYQWDFCAGDLNRNPVCDTLVTPLLSSPLGMDIATDGVNWYGFIANFGGSISRIDFGNSLDNVPITVPPFTVAGLSTPTEIRLVNDNGHWYAIVSNYGANNLLELDMDSLTNITPDTNIISTGGLNGPYQSIIVKDHSSYKALVAMSGSNAIGIYDFINGMTNPPVFSSIILTGTDALFSITAAKDCDQWYALLGYYNNSIVKRINFSGDSISNTIQSIDDIATIPTGGAREVELANDGAKWFGFVMNNNGDNLYRIDFDSALSNPTPAIVSLGLPGLSGDNEFTLEKSGSKWYGFTDNYGTNVIHKIAFPDSCSAIFSTSSNINPQNSIYTSSGTYYISLTVSDSSGNISFYVDSVFVLAAPVAGFYSTPTCINTTVTFTDTSTIDSSGTITSWHWDFGDNIGISNLQNPTYVYANDTTYIVTLTVTGSSGCSSVISHTIEVHNLPVAAFSFIDNQCSRTLIQFNDLSVAPSGDSIAAWEWNFGDTTLVDNSQNPLHSFDSSGTFIVQLIAFTNAGCSDTITDTITILSRPLADFIISNTCVGDTAYFTNMTTGGVSVTYNWDFGDLSASSTNANPTHYYTPSSQTYAVTLIDSSTNGCMDTIVKNVRISTPANPGFFYNPINICQGNSVQFIDTSTIAVGDTIDHSTWNFGDSPTLFVGDTITHIYADTGTYIITLTVTALTACDSSMSITVHVLESPIANFTSTNNVCLGSGMSFYDSSYIPAGTQVDSIVWDFGDSTYASGNTVAHVYAIAGTYNVIQTVYNNFVCYGTVTHQVTVYAVPQALFITGLACTGKAVQFTDLSYVQNDSISSWMWDFGNGDTDTLQNPLYNYGNNIGIYSVSLIVTSLHGCQATITQTITVYESPLFTFTDSLFCLGDSTHFTFVPLNFATVQNWHWYFGDFLESPYKNPIHLYSNAQNYNVSLVVTTNNGCSDSVSQPVTINPKPVAGILSDTIACSGTAIIFNDNSIISSGAINQWSWDFGDGSAIVTFQNTSHNYGNDSTFNVIHTVVSNFGCADNDTMNVTIVPMPVASFTPNPTFGSPPLQVQFSNTSTGAISYQWTFGDGGTDIGFSPSYTYMDTGYFAVTLVAKNSYGCSDTAYSDISVLIPYLDLAVKEIYSFPNNDLLTLKSDLVNLGNLPIYKFQISAKIQNGSPINEQWASSLPLNPGQKIPYTFTARYVIDPFNIPSFYCIEISEINDGDDAVESNNKKCASIGDLFELFAIYPNPANDQINISMNVPLDGTIEITIYNSIGQLVKLNAEIPVTKGYNEFNYSFRNFAKGIYAISVKYRDDIRTQKVLKK